MTSPKSPAVSIIIHKVKRVLLLAVLLLQGHPLYSTVYVLSFSLNYNYMYHCDHKNYPLRHILHGSSSSGSGSGSGSPRRTRRFYSSSSSPSAVTATTAAATNSATSTITIDLPFTEYYTPPATEATATATEATTTTTTISTGTPVLLLHGLLGSKRNFASLATSLGNQLEVKRRILGVDLRNHGDNPKDQWQPDMSYTSMAKDVVQFLDQQGLDQVVLVGHSMGGKVAQTIALLYPNRVQGLCVLDMAPVAYQATEPHWKAVSDIITTLQSILSSEMEKYTKQQVDKLLQSSIPDPALRGFCLTNYDNRQQEWAIPVHYIADNLNTLAGFDIITHTTTTDHHDNTNHPADSTIVNGDAPSSTVASSAVALQYQGDVFFILGGQSKFVRHAHIDTIATYFPNHMLTTIRGSGHWVHAEAPDDTIALLKRYLDR